MKPPMLLKYILAAALLFISGVSHAADEMPVVRINDFPGVGNPMARVLVDEKICERHGLTCTLQTIPSASLAIQALVGGSIDVASAGADSGLLAAARGMSLKVLGNALADTNFFLATAKHVHADIRDANYPAVMHQLKGKKIGVAARGSAAEHQFAALARGAGMSTDDFTMVAVGGPDTAYSALQHKQVDALLAFEPVAAFCTVLDTCNVAIDMRKGQGPKELIDLNGAAAPNFIRAEYAEKNPKIVAALEAAFKDAEKYYTNAEKWDTVVSITQRRFPINNPKADEIIETALRNTQESVRFTLEPQALQQMADFLYRTKQIKSPLDTRTLLLSDPTQPR